MVFDTGDTPFVEARRLLKPTKIRKAETVAIRVGDGRTIQSLGGVDVTVCLGEKHVIQHRKVLDTYLFDIVIGTDFVRRNPQVKLVSLQHPYALHTATSAVAFSRSLCSRQDKKNPVCAT